MGKGRKKLYIPITRSGSSIIASIVTQIIEEGRRRRNAEIQARLSKREISPGYAFFLMHPVLCIWTVGMVGFLLFAWLFL